MWLKAWGDFARAGSPARRTSASVFGDGRHCSSDAPVKKRPTHVKPPVARKHPARAWLSAQPPQRSPLCRGESRERGSELWAISQNEDAEAASSGVRPEEQKG